MVGEFTRQAPGRRAARLLLATGPVAGSCWAAALILARAWTWPTPASTRLGFGAALLLAVAGLAAAATSRHSYQRLIILVLDATAVTAVLLTTPTRTWALGALTARMLPRLAVR